ncbi:MAG: tetratricopeptide repeat protein, partial [Candidatus Margulisiibacteriota bacterium]
MKTKYLLILFLTISIIALFSMWSFGIAKISNDILFENAKYKFMVEKNPDDAWAHFNLAMTYAYMGKVEQGLKELAEVDKL